MIRWVIAATLAAGLVVGAYASEPDLEMIGKVRVRNGGTGAVNATDARTNLGLGASGNAEFAKLAVGGATATAWSAANQAIWAVGTYTGSGTGPYAEISVADTAAQTGYGALSGLRIDHSVNTGAGAGNRIALYPTLNFNAPTPGTDGLLKFYTGMFAQTYVNSGDGGTGGTAYGNFYGAAAIAEAHSGATFMKGIQGAEIDVSVQAGASVELKSILTAWSVNSDAVKGSVHDAMLTFGRDTSTVTAKWDYGITFGRADAAYWPIEPLGTIIGVVGSGTRTALNGIDWSPVTFTGCSYKSTGFCVDPVGRAASVGVYSTEAVQSAGANAGFAFQARDLAQVWQWYATAGVARLFDGTADRITVAATTGNITVLGNVNQFGSTTPAHLASGQTTAPALTSCGTGSPTAAGSTDTAGTVTMGTNATGCVITFNVAYAAVPHCVGSWPEQALASQSYVTAAGSITLTQTSTSGNKFTYICVGRSGG